MDVCIMYGRLRMYVCMCEVRARTRVLLFCMRLLQTRDQWETRVFVMSCHVISRHVRVCHVCMFVWTCARVYVVCMCVWQSMQHATVCVLILRLCLCGPVRICMSCMFELTP